MLKIRQFSIADSKEVMEIRKISSLTPWSKKLYKELYRKHPNGFLVAELSKKIVGCILTYKETHCTGIIRTLAVDPSHRKKGIGTELINFAIKQSKKTGVKKLLLHVRTWNKEAIDFYKKFGFEIVEIIKKHYKNGDDAYTMELKIVDG